MMAKERTVEVAKKLACAAQRIDGVKLVVVLNDFEGQEDAVYVYGPDPDDQAAACLLIQELAKEADVDINDNTWHVAMRPAAVERCERIYAGVAKGGNVACLGLDYGVYFVDLRQTPITAAVTPPGPQAETLPEDVVVLRLYHDTRTGREHKELETLMSWRATDAARALVEKYALEVSPAFRETCRNTQLAAQMLIDLAPKAVELIEKHKVK